MATASGVSDQGCNFCEQKSVEKVFVLSENFDAGTRVTAAWTMRRHDKLQCLTKTSAEHRCNTAVQGIDQPSWERRHAHQA